MLRLFFPRLANTPDFLYAASEMDTPLTRPEWHQKIDDLSRRYDALKGKLNLEEKRTELAALQSKMEAPDFWNDPTRAQKISRQATHLEKFLTLWKGIESGLQDAPQLLEMASDAELPQLSQEMEQLEADFSEGELRLLLNGEHDASDVLLQLHVGNGGQDAEDFTRMLFRMYVRFAQLRGFYGRILDESATGDGLRSGTLEIKGDHAYGWLKSEHGVHRLIRQSPFNAKGLRQTSFASVEVLPLIEEDTDLTIDPKDLRIDVFRSSGSGGQSVNTTDSAVRVTYLPLNLVVTCQNERSQMQNKENALKILRSRLAQLQHQQHVEKLSQLRGEQMEAAFGSQIRTYTLHPYKLVKDHRTNWETSNPDAVLEGDLDACIESFLKQ